MSTMKLACSVRELKKEYALKGETVRALRGVSFDVPRRRLRCHHGTIRFR